MTDQKRESGFLFALEALMRTMLLFVKAQLILDATHIELDSSSVKPLSQT